MATIDLVRPDLQGRELHGLVVLAEEGAAARIGAARVRVANVGGEKFEKAIGGAFAFGGDERGGAVVEGDELVHGR
jgi:hypothetical protein